MGIWDPFTCTLLPLVSCYLSHLDGKPLFSVALRLERGELDLRGTGDVMVEVPVDGMGELQYLTNLNNDLYVLRCGSRHRMLNGNVYIYIYFKPEQRTHFCIK